MAEAKNAKTTFEELTGTQKSAILMMLVGEDEATEILKNLSPREVQHLGASMYSVITEEDDVDLDAVEIQEGESLEDIKAKLKPKKSAISPEMLDTANTYDDKVAVIRMIVSDEAGRVSNVFKSMIQKDLDSA